jgi:type IV pilus assembly protein PilO
MANLTVDIKDMKLQNLPKPVRVIIVLLPAVLVVVLVVFLAIMPKKEEIDKLTQEIQKQEKELAKSQSMAARLEELKIENEKLKQKLKELEEQLPEEYEISSLLKQVSDLGIEAGLEILTWKPAAKRMHPSKVVYEVPVSVSLRGSYHDLGAFFSSLTRLQRIVNITNISLGKPQARGNFVELGISFSAVTFTAVEEGSILQ